MQCKTTVSCCYTPIRMSKIKTLIIANADMDKKLAHSQSLKRDSHCAKYFGGSF